MMQVLHKNSLPLGGFAGLKEHRLVVDNRVGGRGDTWDGIGNFVYLADAYFDPYGETKMHPHRELDVISVMLEGNINHEGSLENGASISAGQVQVQRAGGEGFKHNEINPNASKNRMLQIWVLPEKHGELSSYKLYNLEQGKLTHIYGGSTNQTETFYSNTIIEVGILSENKEISKKGEFLAYITKGTGNLNGTLVKDGDLIRDTNLKFIALSEVTQITIITKR